MMRQKILGVRLLLAVHDYEMDADGHGSSTPH